VSQYQKGKINQQRQSAEGLMAINSQICNSMTRVMPRARARIVAEGLSVMLAEIFDPCELALYKCP